MSFKGCLWTGPGWCHANVTTAFKYENPNSLKNVQLDQKPVCRPLCQKLELGINPHLIQPRSNRKLENQLQSGKPLLASSADNNALCYILYCMYFVHTNAETTCPQIEVGQNSACAVNILQLSQPLIH